MAFQKGQKPGPGRPRGVANKTTLIAKEVIAQAADKLGGAPRLIEWAQSDPKNEQIFWGTIYPKLLPLQVSGEGGGPIQTESLLSWIPEAMKRRNQAP